MKTITIKHYSPSGIAKKRFVIGENPKFVPTDKVNVESVELLSNGNAIIITRTKQ